MGPKKAKMKVLSQNQMNVSLLLVKLYLNFLLEDIDFPMARSRDMKTCT